VQSLHFNRFTEISKNHAEQVFTQPSSPQIYEEVMREGVNESSDANREAAEQRPHKILGRDAIRQKHAMRSGRASLTKAAKSGKRWGICGLSHPQRMR
jgi:hypothetical protein